MAPAAKDDKKRKAPAKEPKAKKEKKEKRVVKPSAYMVFGKVMRPKIKQDEPDTPTTEIMGKIAAKWREMSEKEKEKYQKLADKEWNESDGPARLEAQKAKNADEKKSGKKSKSEKAPAAKKAKKSKKKEESEEEEEPEEEAEAEAEAEGSDEPEEAADGEEEEDEE